MNKTIINQLICIVNNALLVRKKFISVPFTNESFFFLYTLYTESYLEYLFVKNNNIFFKIKYSNGYPIIKKIKFFSKKGQKKILSFTNLWNAFQHFHKQTIFYTTKKLLPDYIIKKVISGGQVFIIISI